MLEWSHPWLFLLLPLPWVVWSLAPPYRTRTRALRIPFFQRIASAARVEPESGAHVRHRNRIQTGALWLVWVLLVAGLARPLWVGEPIVRREATRDIMLAIDLSGSMDYADFPNADGGMSRRFDAVQRVVDAFVAGREGDRIGLIVFGTRAFLQLPFTTDTRTARDLVQLMDVAMAGPQTVIGDAIGLAINTFDSSEVENRLLILLTDGHDTGSRMTPLNAAEIAHSRGVEIYTIGVGDPAAGGQDRVDFDVLQRIAERTGGQFFTADDEAALSEVYARIDAISPGETRTRSWRPRDSLVHWPIGLALGVAGLAFIARLLTLRRRTTA